ncbi:hypothetical protein K9N68_06690 [Kovacikia minuta CCNUW1]|uniref:RipA family octameric membrane protein n=1 Tax=Kovacikia minuta TaxID=2931930 RepID=UPI001CCE98EF|nr:hypothetical protein [Kovacikia minuta]UBF27606.1 hypothetical protein K9N68_06690 [Kovacikia minuta CCNUW1]
MSDEYSSKQSYSLFEHVLHEDTMFNDRLNFFLIFESVIMGIVGVLYQKSTPSLPIIRTLIVLAIILTFIWGYVQARQKWMLDCLTARSLKEMDDYRAIVEERKRGKWPIGNLALLAYVVPTVVVVLWLTLLFTLS